MMAREWLGAGFRWERGRPARNAALGRGDTLILAFSHKGLAALHFFAALNPVCKFSAHGIRRRVHNRF